MLGIVQAMPNGWLFFGALLIIFVAALSWYAVRSGREISFLDFKIGSAPPPELVDGEQPQRVARIAFRPLAIAMISSPMGDYAYALSSDDGGAPFIIGRSEECELVLTDRFASRRHASLTIEVSSSPALNRQTPTMIDQTSIEGSGRIFQLTIQDLRSKSGIKCNSMKVTTAVLNPGDLIRIGNSTIEFF